MKSSRRGHSLGYFCYRRKSAVAACGSVVVFVIMCIWILSWRHPNSILEMEVSQTSAELERRLKASTANVLELVAKIKLIDERTAQQERYTTSLRYANDAVVKHRDWKPIAPIEAGLPAIGIPKCNNISLPLQSSESEQGRNTSDIYQCRQVEVVLIHIPKTGGTSIEHAAKQSSYGIQWGFQYERSRFRKIRRDLPKVSTQIPACLGNWGSKCCSWWHIPPRRLHDWRPYYGAQHKFCVVRNPYSRALSEYSFSHGKDVRKLSCSELNATDVNVWLRTQMLAFVAGNTLVNDCHWIPQYQYIEPGVRVWNSDVSSVHGTTDAVDDLYDSNVTDAYLAHGPDNRSCTHVLRMESMSESFPQLMSVFNLSNIQLPHSSKSFASRCKNVSILDIDTQSLIRQLYYQDFFQFGYPM